MRILVRRPGIPNLCPTGIVDPLCTTEAVGVHRGRSVLYDSVSLRLYDVVENGAHLLQVGSVVLLPAELSPNNKEESAQVGAIQLSFSITDSGIVDCETKYTLERAV